MITRSYLQTACILGYSSLPIVLAALCSLFTDMISYIFTLILCLLAFALAMNSAYSFFVVVVTDNNKAMVLFPVLLFMFLLMWQILMVI